MKNIVSFRVRNLRLLTNLLNAVSAVVEEATFKASKESLRLISLDPSHVAMVHLELSEKFFEEYEYLNTAEEAFFTFNLNNLLKILRKTDAVEGGIKLVYDDDNAQQRWLFFSTENQSFTLPLLIPSSSKPSSILHLSFEANFAIEPKTLARIADLCNHFSDYIRITATKENVEILAKSDYNGIASFKFPNPNLEGEGPVSAAYSLHYFSSIINAIKPFDQATIEFATNKPVKISVTIPEAVLEFFIAPRQE